MEAPRLIGINSKIIEWVETWQEGNLIKIKASAIIESWKKWGDKSCEHCHIERINACQKKQNCDQGQHHLQLSQMNKTDI